LASLITAMSGACAPLTDRLVRARRRRRSCCRRRCSAGAADDVTVIKAGSVARAAIFGGVPVPAGEDRDVIAVGLRRQVRRPFIVRGDGPSVRSRSGLYSAPLAGSGCIRRGSAHHWGRLPASGLPLVRQ
jgi:hypothetical protein